MSEPALATQIKHFSILDVPGGHFTDTQKDNPDAQSSMQKAKDSVAIIIFIDCEIFSQLGRDAGRAEWEMIRRQVTDILKGAARAIAKGSILPVTFIFSKFDVFQDNDGVEVVHKAFFNEFVIKMSNIDSRILAMYCPVSILSQDFLLKPRGCEYPFLFSFLGVVLSQLVDSMSRIENLRSIVDYHEDSRRNAEIEWQKAPVKQMWKRITTGEKSASMHEALAKREELKMNAAQAAANADLALASSIASGLALDCLLSRADLLFAQAGDPIPVTALRGLFA